jgi:hypothetical protein
MLRTRQLLHPLHDMPAVATEVGCYKDGGRVVGLYGARGRMARGDGYAMSQHVG